MLGSIVGHILNEMGKNKTRVMPKNKKAVSILRAICLVNVKNALIYVVLGTAILLYMIRVGCFHDLVTVESYSRKGGKIGKLGAAVREKLGSHRDSGGAGRGYEGRKKHGR